MSRSYWKESLILKLPSKTLEKRLDCGGVGEGWKNYQNLVDVIYRRPVIRQENWIFDEFECSKLNAVNKQICVYNPTKHMSNMRSIRPVS